MNDYSIILILRPQPYWALVSCELKRVSSLGRYMDVKGAVINAGTEDLLQLAKLCAEMQLDALYLSYANKKVYRHQKDFWESDDKTLQRYVKRMTDQRLLKAVRMADSQDIPILYAPTESAPLHIDDRLLLDETTLVTPVMYFNRHDHGTNYQLQLRFWREEPSVPPAPVGFPLSPPSVPPAPVGFPLSPPSVPPAPVGFPDGFLITPADHRLAVLGHEPGLFVLDNRLLLFGEGFSAKLLLPFVKKKEVEIPRHMENDYFRRFILRNVSKAEVVATGFDIEDTGLEPSPCLVVEKSFVGDHLLSLRFRYGDIVYSFDNKSGGRVQLQETDDGFRFIRNRRNRQAEQQAVEAVKKEDGRLSSQGCLHFDTMATMIEWLRLHGQQLRQQGIEVVQPSEQVYYIP